MKVKVDVNVDVKFVVVGNAGLSLNSMLFAISFEAVVWNYEALFWTFDAICSRIWTKKLKICEG